MFWFAPLAHGALGYWDEAIFIGVAVIFFALMLVSWVRSRATEPDFDDAPFEPHTQKNDAPDSGDRFQLD